MINSIIEAISIALNEEFGDEYTVYNEEIKQGLKEPCFFVSCINPTHKLFLGKRYFRTNQFAIQYFPINKLRANEECSAVADRLYMCLEYITVTGDLIRGNNMRYEIEDGILNFFINYDLFVHKLSEFTPMEELKENVKIKE